MDRTGIQKHLPGCLQAGWITPGHTPEALPTLFHEEGGKPQRICVMGAQMGHHTKVQMCPGTLRAWGNIAASLRDSGPRAPLPHSGSCAESGAHSSLRLRNKEPKLP